MSNIILLTDFSNTWREMYNNHCVADYHSILFPKYCRNWSKFVEKKQETINVDFSIFCVITQLLWNLL